MKIKNINIGDFIEAKNKNGGDISYDVLEVGKSYKVLGFSEDSDLTVIISVPDHKLFSDGFYVCHECFRKPKPQLKQLDQSVFNGIDEKWRFAAVDGKRGFPVVYEFKPYASELGRYYTNRHGLYKDLTHLTGYDTSNWQNSLIKRDEAELTGSDLCRAMLERGDKWVLCLVANNPKNIDLNQEPDVVISHDENGFYIRDSYYSCALPISIKGELLTASEVGL